MQLALHINVPPARLFVQPLGSPVVEVTLTLLELMFERSSERIGAGQRNRSGSILSNRTRAGNDAGNSLRRAAAVIQRTGH